MEMDGHLPSNRAPLNFSKSCYKGSSRAEGVERSLPIFFYLFTYCVCLFCARIGDNIMKLDATVIQVRVLASYKTRFNPPFSTFENACTKSGI